MAIARRILLLSCVKKLGIVLIIIIIIIIMINCTLIPTMLGVPDIIGCLQALEAIKVSHAVGEPLSGRKLLLDALSARICVAKIRGRSLQCVACGENATLTEHIFRDFDYEKFTQSPLSTDQ
ncbi:Adenylyltransferase and sulfurtransferase MOCS3 [Orobanche minor]